MKILPSCSHVAQWATCCTICKRGWVWIGHESFENSGSVLGWHSSRGYTGGWRKRWVYSTRGKFLVKSVKDVKRPIASCLRDGSWRHTFIVYKEFKINRNPVNDEIKNVQWKTFSHKNDTFKLVLRILVNWHISTGNFIKIIFITS